MGTPPTPIPPLRWTGISAASVHGLTMVHVRATFQATVLPVLTLTAGPNTETPAFAARRICAAGQSPASRTPSYSSSPCMPSTNSLAMPIWMPQSG